MGKTPEEIIAERVQAIKKRLGDRSEIYTDDQLSAALSDAEQALRAQRIDTEIHSGLVYRVAVCALNRFGSEGVGSESFDGISQVIMKDLPKDLMRDIIAVRQVVW